MNVDQRTRQPLERLAERGRRRRGMPPRAPRLELGERVRLARLGLAHLWASRRPWDRLELGHARSLESAGRRQLLAAWLGSWDQVGPQAATLTRRELEAPELERRRLVDLQHGLGLVGLALLAWWRSCG